jgi:hypothetical protein
MSNPYIMKKGASGLADLSDGYLALGAFAAGAKSVYYVDGNCGVDGRTGKGGWKNAVKTLTHAILISNADIASGKFGYAARNVIFARGDAFVENLTTLPNKCDLIGVGSYNAHPFPGITGVHPIGSGTYMGTRLINLYFDFAGDAASNLLTVPTTTSGLKVVHCTFDGKGTTPAGSAIVGTGLAQFEIVDCHFKGAYSDSVIELLSGEFNDLLIKGNLVQGADVGIEIVAATTSEGKGWIVDNYVHTTGVGIKDSSGIMGVVNNRVITAAALTSTGAGAIVDGAGKSVGNLGTSTVIENAHIPPLGTLT